MQMNELQKLTKEQFHADNYEFQLIQDFLMDYDMTVAEATKFHREEDIVDMTNWLFKDETPYEIMQKTPLDRDARILKIADQTHNCLYFFHELPKQKQSIMTYSEDELQKRILFYAKRCLPTQEFSQLLMKNPDHPIIKYNKKILEIIANHSHIYQLRFGKESYIDYCDEYFDERGDLISDPELNEDMEMNL